MKTNTIILYHQGFFDYEVLNQLLYDFSVLVTQNDIQNYFYKKIQIVMAELLENNYQYTQSNEIEFAQGKYIPEFKIIKHNQGFEICASNPILTNDAYLLQLYLDKINNSNLSELKEIYKEILKAGMHSPKKTSGTGLIRIAKVTKNKFKYSFRKINNKLLYYTLEIMVNSK